MPNESAATREFCRECDVRGAYTRALVGSVMQVGLPDRLFIGIDGVIRLIEFKAHRKQRLGLIESYESLGLRFSQHLVFSLPKDSSACAVVVQHPIPSEWRLYRFVRDKSRYELQFTGRDNCIKWAIGCKE